MPQCPSCKNPKTEVVNAGLYYCRECGHWFGDDDSITIKEGSKGSGMGLFATAMTYKMAVYFKGHND